MGRYLDKLKQFDQGQPERPEPQAETIIMPDETVPKDREPSGLGSRAQRTAYQPAEPSAKPVYWESPSGRICGPGTLEILAQDGNSFWIAAVFEGQLRRICADRLRTRQAFERQAQPREVELIKEPR